MSCSLHKPPGSAHLNLRVKYAMVSATTEQGPKMPHIYKTFHGKEQPAWALRSEIGRRYTRQKLVRC